MEKYGKQTCLINEKNMVPSIRKYSLSMFLVILIKCEINMKNVKLELGLIFVTVNYCLNTFNIRY